MNRRDALKGISWVLEFYYTVGLNQRVDCEVEIDQLLKLDCHFSRNNGGIFTNNLNKYQNLNDDEGKELDKEEELQTLFDFSEPKGMILLE